MTQSAADAMLAIHDHLTEVLLDLLSDDQVTEEDRGNTKEIVDIILESLEAEAVGTTEDGAIVLKVVVPQEQAG